jgi:hypothetical protein
VLQTLALHVLPRREIKLSLKEMTKTRSRKIECRGDSFKGEPGRGTNQTKRMLNAVIGRVDIAN